MKNTASVYDALVEYGYVADEIPPWIAGPAEIATRKRRAPAAARQTDAGRR